MNIEDLLTDEPLENFLMEDEVAVFLTLSSDQQDRYLTACSSYKAMQAYLNNPTEPAAAKALLNPDAWK